MTNTSLPKEHPISVLIVEDDPNLGFVLQEYLTQKGFEVTLKDEGEAGAEAFRNGHFNLCIVDVMLPKKDGFSVAREIRAIDEEVPVIFVTAKGMKEDKIEGFTIGADDYITKPFSIEELLMRIHAILRRVQRSDERQQRESSTIAIGNYVFDATNQLLAMNGYQRQLTAKEAHLLKVLCDYKNHVLRRDIALKEVWGDDSYFNGRSMDGFITRLRKYLKDDPSVEITNVHGVGFKLQVQ